MIIDAKCFLACVQPAGGAQSTFLLNGKKSVPLVSNTRIVSTSLSWKIVLIYENNYRPLRGWSKYWKEELRCWRNRSEKKGKRKRRKKKEKERGEKKGKRKRRKKGKRKRRKKEENSNSRHKNLTFFWTIYGEVDFYSKSVTKNYQ